MGGVRKLSVTSPIKKRILDLTSNGQSRVEVSRSLGLAKSTITQVLKRIDAEKSIHRKKSTGRPRKTGEKDDRAILLKSKRNPRLTAVDIQADLARTTDIRVSTSTVKRRLNEQGLFGRHGVRKPLIRSKNRTERMRWARDHRDWTMSQWSNVIFSDESKFVLFGTDGIQWVRRPIGHRNDPQYQIPTVEHGGGNVMVWGCFTMSGVGPLVRIKGTMDSHMYTDILKQHLLPFARGLKRPGWIFQQDNDPKHTSSHTKAWFKWSKVRVMPWPSQSPDLNPIEHLWDELGRRMKGANCSNPDQLFERLEQEWHAIDQSVINRLLTSMNSRCSEVLKTKGFATRY